VLQPRGKPDGVALASLFTTMLHTGALGALLTFGPAPWYPVYAATERFGLTLLEDQQLGGLVMWVPGGLSYLLVALYVIGAHWLSPKPEPR
jgi:putative membrane protein